MQLEVNFDYLSATFPFVVEANESVDAAKTKFLLIFTNYFNVDHDEVKRADYASNRFKYQYQLGKAITLRLGGPMNEYGFETCQLELKGEGCREFEIRNPEKKWINLIYFLASINCKFRRIDLAIDDFYGNHITMEYLLDKVLKKEYTSSFTLPCKPTGTIEDGLSLYFGTNKSPFELVIYDKLKERLKRNDTVDKDYWVRYEMRFRADKAQSIIEQIIHNNKDYENPVGFDLLKVAKEQLYRGLDIKEENNYNKSNKSKATTDESWLDFLDNVEKGKLKSEAKLSSSYEQHYNYCADKVVFLLIFKFLELQKNQNLFETEVYRFMHKHSNLSKDRFHRLNTHLKELNLPTLTSEQLDELKNELVKIIEERELPF